MYYISSEITLAFYLKPSRELEILNCTTSLSILIEDYSQLSQLQIEDKLVGAIQISDSQYITLKGIILREDLDLAEKKILFSTTLNSLR